MTIVLAGGSGFLGRKIAARLEHDRHHVVVLTRRQRQGRHTDVAWHPDGSAGSLAGHLDGADAVVNLAGEGIADRRWSRDRKAALRDSRLLATRTLVGAMATCQTPPRVLVSASGVGYYGRFRTVGTLYWENYVGLRAAAEIFCATDEQGRANVGFSGR